MSVYFDAVLYPHRSLPRHGFRIVMGLFGAIGVVIGTGFLLLGAWPVFGFLGLDVLLLSWALRRNDRSGRMVETVRLTEDALTVCRIDEHGTPRTWTFQPYWLRVTMDDPPRHESQVTLSSHGRSLVVAAFLAPEERLDFARALCRALDRQRRCRPWTQAPA